jgi:hypothetical protein
VVAAFLVTVHVWSVFWLVAGIFGRDVCHANARRAPSLDALRTVAGLGSVFELRFVRPATFVVLVTGLIAAWMRGWPFLGFVDGSGPWWLPLSILAYLSIIPVIVLVFIPRGRAYRVALAEADSRNEITPAVRAALHDRVVDAARAYELVMVGVLAWLMIAKPF